MRRITANANTISHQLEGPPRADYPSYAADIAEAGRHLVELVDDLSDSGVTLKAGVERLRGMPSISELRSAVVWTKGVSNYMPDYFVELLPTSPWIHQPFEAYDDMRPDALAKKFVI